MNDTEDRIRDLAHRIWEERGRPEGEAERHWEEARRRVAAEMSAPQNPAAGHPIERPTPADADDVPAIAADAAASAAITGVPGLAATARKGGRRR